MHLRVRGELFQRVAKDFCCQPIILFFQRQFAAGQISVAQIGVGPFCLVEEIFEHQLGLGAEQQRRFAQRDQVGRIAVHPSAGAAAIVDFLEQTPRLVGPAIGIEHLAAGQTQPDARAVKRQGVR